MPVNHGKTSIYLVCFHSEKPKHLECAKRQFRTVETAIQTDEWPYDNGDDPSFYVARKKGGRLTWGICRQDLRNAIHEGSIVVFFSFSSLEDDKVLYRLCAVATVEGKVDHRSAHSDLRLERFRGFYINGLITRAKGGWRHDESDRHFSERHPDWLWRMANHQGVTKEKFDKQHLKIYKNNLISDADLSSNKLILAGNYVIFSAIDSRTFISPNPPDVAVAVKAYHEEWTNKKLQKLTVGEAKSQDKTNRDYLRTANKLGYVHRQIRFEIPTDEAEAWREKLINALKSESRNAREKDYSRVSRTVTC
jgi:hypothetical protein